MKNNYFLIGVFLFLNSVYISAQVPLINKQVVAKQDLNKQDLDKKDLDKAIKEIKDFEKLVNTDQIKFDQPLVKSAVLQDLKEAKSYIADLKDSIDKGDVTETDKMFTAEVVNKLNEIKTSADKLSVEKTNELQVTLTPECATNNLDFYIKFVTWRGTNTVEKTYIFYKQKYSDGTTDLFNGGALASFPAKLPDETYWFWAQSLDGSLKSCPRTLERNCRTEKVQNFYLLDPEELKKQRCEL